MYEFEAIILDLDGTLIEDGGGIRPRVRSALQRISDGGVHVMVATGRSEQSAAPAIEELQILNPMVIYNGAAVYCPRSRSLIEERNLDLKHLDQLLDYAETHDLLPVVMCAGSKRALSPRSEALNYALHDMKAIEIVPPIRCESIDPYASLSFLSGIKILSNSPTKSEPSPIRRPISPGFPSISSLLIGTVPCWSWMSNLHAKERAKHFGFFNNIMESHPSAASQSEMRPTIARW